MAKRRPIQNKATESFEVLEVVICQISDKSIPIVGCSQYHLDIREYFLYSFVIGTNFKIKSNEHHNLSCKAGSWYYFLYSLDV
jgi:hypothetical protein